MTDRPHTSPAALARYAALWAVAGVVIALGVLLVLRIARADPGPPARADPILAVAGSDCVLEQPRHVSAPPVSGPRSPTAPDGIYASPRPRRRLVGALRRGVVVVQYRRSVAPEDVGALRRTFAAGSPRRILAPDGTGMPFAVAATSWGRVLGCARVDVRVLRALRAFAQRYEGEGPDA